MDEAFLRALRDALNHLYDPDFLRRSPLIGWLGLGERPDATSELRRTLSEAIEALEPSPDEPPHSRVWRLYNALHYLYIQQMSQDEAADQLAISARQLRREQAAGVMALVDVLSTRAAAQRAPADSVARSRLHDAEQAAPPAFPEEASAGQSGTLRSELAWLGAANLAAAADLGEALNTVVELARPLAAQHRAALSVDLPGDLPRLALHPVALRQILLALLRMAIPHAAGGEVRLTVEPKPASDERIRLVAGCLAPAAGGRAEPLASEGPVQAGMAELLELCDCELALEPAPGGLHAVLWLPASEQISVLVVDDNVDTLNLFERYVAGTRYQVIPTTDPAQITTLVEKYAIRAIVLDVMMPEVDGWEVLARLRQHPRTADLPVIICSVLADEELALALGASMSLRKPLTQGDFLAALDRQLASPGQ